MLVKLKTEAPVTALDFKSIEYLIIWNLTEKLIGTSE